MSDIAEINTHVVSIVNELWDVIVIGTGIGGATIGYSLVQDGHRVLFIEKGKATLLGPDAIDEHVSNPEQRLASAHWPSRLTFAVDGFRSEIFAPLGCGLGGTSNLFAATLERFEPSDFEDCGELKHPTGGWPIKWSDMQPFYEEAERLYQVVGTSDPLSPHAQHRLLPPPPASAIDNQFLELFYKAGLHPYRLHVGFRYDPGCTECGGRLCLQGCRSDARSICLNPALRTARAAILADCEVVKLEANGQKIESVICRHSDTIYRLKARSIVLAAGAYHSPAILLRSKSPEWPEGLANRSGLVGGNLMFHASEWVAVWPSKKCASTGPRKSIGLRDFYTLGHTRLGMLQSTGLSARVNEFHTFIQNWLGYSQDRGSIPLRKLLRFTAKIASRIFDRATIFAMIIEDMPHPGNRVLLDEEDEEKIHIIYRIPDELRKRAALARKHIRKALKGVRTMPLQSDVQLNYGHPCGTCRFGKDPATSVLDKYCKAHGVDNLYVVDASFMPTGGGANPSLTIAANALRVGRELSKRLAVT